MIKKIILWTVLVILLVTGGLIVFMYYNQDYLKKEIIAAVNQRLKVPVDVTNISISPLSAFPDATVRFSNVKIQDPEVEDQIFAEAESVGFSFNIWQLLKGEMVLEEISVINATVNVIRYPEKWSYEIYNEVEKSEDKHISFNIQRIKLDNIVAIYHSPQDSTYWAGTIDQAIASVRIEGPVTWINLNSTVNSDILKIKQYETLKEQNVSLNTEIVADKHWRISTKELAIGDSKFQLFANKNDDAITVDFKALDATIKTLFSLTPHQIKARLSNYSSSGNITLETSWTYNLSTEKTAMSGALLFDDVDLSQKEPQIDITDFSFKGSIDIPDFSNLKNSYLALNNAKGKINNAPFQAEIKLRNLKEPFLDLVYQGEMPLSLLSDLGNLGLSEPSGILQININIAGSTASMKNSEGLKNIKASGDINLYDIYVRLPNRSFALDAPSGNIIFNNDHIAINDLSLSLGASKFNVNGQLRNFWHITSTKPWSATADIYSSNLDLDQLLSVENKSATAKNYQFNLPEHIKLELNAQVDALVVRRFKAKRISGKIIVADSKLEAQKLSFESMGGVVKLMGDWKDLNKAGSLIDANFLLSGIQAKELFHSFENFGQDFITDDNLSGKIYAEVKTSLRLDQNLAFQPSSLTATLNTKIIEGQLVDFEPLYHLEKYLNNADLSKVQFAELENQIYIQNETVHLPMMAVGTNIIKFKIGGTHTFNQYIDYDVVAPLIRKEKVDKDTRFGEVAEDQHGESLIFLSIAGTTENFDVSIDKQAVKKEIASDVKREIKDLQDAFKKKNKKTEEVELDEDDYFDWEEENNM
ncbi:MAG: AsmA family protein [Candidatus Cyclobacteriaceae bacterium M2_1C_046]